MVVVVDVRTEVLDDGAARGGGVEVDVVVVVLPLERDDELQPHATTSIAATATELRLMPSTQPTRRRTPHPGCTHRDVTGIPSRIPCDTELCR